MQPPAGGPLLLAGTFLEVSPPERLQYTWRWESGVPGKAESIVTVEFHERGAATEVILTHTDLPTDEPIEPYRDGWESGLDKLETELRRSSASSADPETAQP